MKSSYVYINDIRLHYLHANLDSDQQPIVFIHGLASNARIWELVTARLMENGYPLLAPEARGHGLTDKTDTGYGFEQITSDLRAFIEICHLEKPLLVGHSWGGALALNYAARQPFGPYAPRGIVLVDGGMLQMNDAPDANWEDIQQRLAPPNLVGTPVETFLTNVKEWTADWLPKGEKGDQIISIILSNFSVDENECIAPHLTYDRHMTLLHTIWEFQTYEIYSKVRCPVLMIPASPKDPDGSQRVHLEMKKRGIIRAGEDLPDLQVHWMNDTIHDVPLQRPEELAHLIEGFLSTLPDPRV